jgi:hypothetical protein
MISDQEKLMCSLYNLITSHPASILLAAAQQRSSRQVSRPTGILFSGITTEYGMTHYLFELYLIF